MATLEKNFNMENEETSSSQQQKQVEYDDDSVLENLSKEPMEQNSCLTLEVIDSLHSVKNMCLTVLDLLLTQMVNNIPNKQSRRLSDVLTSITQNTNLLKQESMASPMIRSKSSPPPSTISDVYKILDSDKIRQQNDQNYTLCCTLAALLNHVYRLLDLCSTHDQKVVSTGISQDVNSLQQELYDKVSHFQRERAAGISSITGADQEITLIWDEMDPLMTIVCNIIALQKQKREHAPPAYDNSHSVEDTKDPPAYESIFKSSCWNTAQDLDHLLDAIDRLFTVAPSLSNQRASLSENQIKQLTAATLGKTIERLSRGRMENQRADEHKLLHNLIQQIQKSASRSLDNQRVHLTPQLQKKIDFASIQSILDRLNKGRYTNQDWISHEEILIHDLTHTADLLAKSLDRPAYNRQRFYMTDTKERNLFMHGLLDKVESLEGYRLTNQDADFPKAIQDQNDDDLQQLLNHIYDSSKPQLDNQRASFTY